MNVLLNRRKMDIENIMQTWTADEIASLLAKASDAYYNQDEPVMTDDTFDLLKDHLERIAPKHSFLKKVGAPATGENKVKLPYWMGSLDKIRDDPKALEKWKTKYPGAVIVSDKLDGNSAMIVATKNGLRMYSRGDGEVGQDISHLLPFISGVPKVTEKEFAVRGELIISKENWEKIKDVGANARNVVAGALHRKDPNPRVANVIDFVAYEMLAPHSLSISNQLASLQEMGFNVVFRKLVQGADVSMETLSGFLIARRAQSPYEVDGIVVVHDAIHKRVKNKNPAYGFAYKSILTHEEAEVVVKEVEWNISKDGYIKPTVHFSQVVLAGAKLQKATGFNASYIEKNAIGPGSRVIIIRSGDVIPYITKVLSPSSNGQPSLPTFAYEWNESHVDIRVVGENKDQHLRTMEHFVTTLNIPHVAIGTLKKFVDAGIDTIPKLLAVTENDLLKLDGFQKTSASKISKAIADVKKNVTCVDMMTATNMFGRGLGKKKIELIVQAFPDILDGTVPSIDDMLTIDGIGDATASAFLNGLPGFFALMKTLNMPCRTQKKVKTTDARVSFQNLRVVFTGFRNKEWEEKIEAHGGKVATSISKNVDLVVASDVNDTSTKIKKAHELNIRVMSKQEFQDTYKL